MLPGQQRSLPEHTVLQLLRGISMENKRQRCLLAEQIMFAPHMSTMSTAATPELNQQGSRQHLKTLLDHKPGYSPRHVCSAIWSRLLSDRDANPVHRNVHSILCCRMLRPSGLWAIAHQEMGVGGSSADAGQGGEKVVAAGHLD